MEGLGQFRTRTSAPVAYIEGLDVRRIRSLSGFAKFLGKTDRHLLQKPQESRILTQLSAWERMWVPFRYIQPLEVRNGSGRVRALNWHTSIPTVA